MAEFTDEPTAQIQPEDRKYLYDNKVPSADWTICIGRYEGKKWAPHRYQHFGTAATIRRAETGLSEVYGRYQTTAFVLKTLVVYLCTSTDPLLIPLFRNKVRDFPLAVVWPTRAPVEYRNLKLIDDDLMMRISQEFYYREAMNHFQVRGALILDGPV